MRINICLDIEVTSDELIDIAENIKKTYDDTLMTIRGEIIKKFTEAGGTKNEKRNVN